MNRSLSVELSARTKALEGTETILFAVINIVAFFNNLLTCYAVYRNQRLRTPPNMFVIALGVSGILTVHLLYAFYSCDSVSRPLGVWRELLSISRLRSFHIWSGLSSDYGINCNKSMLPCRQTRKVRGVIQKTKSFAVHCCCLVRGSPWIIASIFLQESRI